MDRCSCAYWDLPDNEGTCRTLSVEPCRSSKHVYVATLWFKIFIFVTNNVNQLGLKSQPDMNEPNKSFGAEAFT